MQIENNFKWYDEEYCLAVVKQNGMLLKYVHNPTEEICLEAIKENGNTLKYINNPTEEMCLEALNQNIKAIKYIDIKKFPRVYEKYLFMVK